MAIIIFKHIFKIAHRFKVVFWALVLLTVACSDSTTHTNSKEKWIATWSTSHQLVEPRNNPPAPGLNGNTLRQVVRVSLGGNNIKLRLSNTFGNAPVEIESVHVSKALDDGQIAPETDTKVYFGNQSKITIEPGETILSDSIEFDLKTRSDVAITMYITAIGTEISGHPGSRTTSYIKTGNTVTDISMEDADAKADRWYIIDTIEVMAPDSSAAVVILGDSITDGYGTDINKQNRWPDELSRRLLENINTQHISVLNHGIGGNCVLKSCLGPSAVSRFERNVLSQNGVKWLIIFEGVNDIGGIESHEKAAEIVDNLKTAYQEMINKAREHNIKVFGATITPFGGSFYDTPAAELARQQINEWIRTNDSFDAIIDFDKALRDPKKPRHILPKADGGDGLHPSVEGYTLMAEFIDLSLFMN